MSQTLNIDLDNWTDNLAIDPQKNIIPAADSQIAEIISAEANYDRWSHFLFPHSKSPGIYGRRTKQWEAKLPDGRIAESMIEVIPAQDAKSYTTKTYDVFLALIAIWKTLNMPKTPMELFLSDIAKKLDVKPSGKALNSILEELRCLEETKISWVFAFQTQSNTEETYKWQRVLSLFHYNKIKERGTGTISGKCIVQFSDHIMQNIFNSVTIPVNFSARKTIKSEVAKAWYNRMDSVLAKIDKFEKTWSNLVAESNLKTGRYIYKSQRKVLLETIQKNLHGIPLSSMSAYMCVDVVETTNKLDWKCVFSKRTTQPSGKLKRQAVVNADLAYREYLVDLICEAVGGRQQNQRFYHKLALYCSEDLIRRAIAEHKEMVALGTIQSKQAYFTALIHGLCHKLGKDWINPCDQNCPYRLENQLF